MSDTAKRLPPLSVQKRELLSALLKKQGVTATLQRAIPRRRESGPAPLSFAQQRLWFLDQFTSDNAAYSIFAALQLRGRLNTFAFEQSLNAMRQRHDMLHTVFASQDGHAVQIVAPLHHLSVPLIDLCSLAEVERDAQMRWLAGEEVRKPFDLAHGPLLRVHLLRLAEQEYVVLLTLHHIIADGWSMGIFIRELSALYEAYVTGKVAAEVFLPLPLQYADFAVWQRDWLQEPQNGDSDDYGTQGDMRGTLNEHLAYWQEQLAGVPVVLDLPTDRPRPAVQSFRGARGSFLLPEILTQELRGVCQRENVTLFMLLHAAFTVLLYRYSGQNDIVVGTPIAGRNWPEVEQVIGFFANTLVLRTKLSNNPSFQELLARVRETALAAYSHQDVPFEQLVEAVQPERNLSHSPLFQIMIALQNAPMPPLDLADLPLRQLEIETGAVPFDLTLSLEEHEHGLRGVLEYSTDLFDEAPIVRMIEHYQTVLEQIVANPQQRIASMPIMAALERQQLLVEWNKTDADYPKNACIHELFTTQARKTPDAVAVCYEDQQITYAALNQRTNQLVTYLQQLGVGPETRVGLSLERSIEMIIGILGILKAGGAYVPLDPIYPAERLAYMREDAQLAVLLTRGMIQSTENLPIDEPEPKATADNAAYVLYTSGSTGQPKGVMVSHRNLVHSTCARLTYYREPVDRFLLLSSFAFDSSIAGIFWTLCQGGRLLYPSESRQQDVSMLLSFCGQQRISHTLCVPSLYSVLLAEADQQQLSSLRVAIVAGEAAPNELLVRHRERVPHAQFFNEYGPTEGTVWSSVCDGRLGGDRATVLIGHPIANVQLYLLDDYLEPVPIGLPGEIYIGGAGVARGYHNRPDLTAERFIPSPFTSESGVRLYKTGDMARYLPDGAVEFLGRNDEQVKVRGYRIELGEIEVRLRQHPAVHDAVVIPWESPNERSKRGHIQESGPSKTLIAYIVWRMEAVTTRDIRNYLQHYLPEYMLPTLIISLTSLPLNSNGKLDRRMLPAPEKTQFEPIHSYVMPQTATETLLVDIWAEVLELDHLDIDDNFFEIGGHSLLATQVISRIRNAFQREVPLRLLFEAPTVAELAERIDTAQRLREGRPIPTLQPMPRPLHLPLSFAQQRLWFLDQFELGSPLYNVTTALRLVGQLDVAVLRESLKEIVQRHEILHTVYALVDGQPVQQIHPNQQVMVPVYDLSCLDIGVAQEATLAKLATAEARRPFDLAHGPLFRVALLRLNASEHVLLLNMHHIVADGWSLGVLIRELAALYGAFAASHVSPLPALQIQYADFALWQRQWLQGDILEAHLSYWERQLTNIPAVLSLPLDSPRPTAQSFRGARLSFILPKALSTDLQALSRREGATLFITLLAGFALLLSRYANQDDIVIGTPIANRIDRQLESLIGFFVNTLVLRTDLSGNPTTHELLAQVRETTLEAYAHQDVPFERLVEALHPERTLSHTPLFQVLFALHNAPMPALELPGLRLQPLEIETGTAKFDLALSMMESEHGLKGTFEYNTDLFDAATIERLSEHWQMVLEYLVCDSKQHVSGLSLLTEAERDVLFHQWNATQAPYSKEVCIHQLLAAQVERTPDAIAIVFDEAQLTYRELDKRANQLAHYLQAHGVGPEAFVGLCLDRSLELIVALLGILKAGGAYVPLDPGFPQRRLAFMAADAQLALVLTQQHLRDVLPVSNTHIVCLDALSETLAAEPTTQPVSAICTKNLAYVLYTSGSTGLPKGVQITHEAVVNFLLAMCKQPGLAQNDHLLSVTTISFDIAGLEIYLPFLVGARLELVSHAIAADGEQLQRRMHQFGVSAMQATPATWRLLLASGWSGDQELKILCGGEALPRELAQALLARSAELWNLYGPTETTIWSVARRIMSAEGERTVPIGKPIANTQVYLLDTYGYPVPLGVTGELYIGGAGLSRGYWNRPELTAERFVPNPFVEASAEVGTLLYRTGDLARYLPDGTLEFFGRADQQVKMRGYRIELEEIEATLETHPAVQQAVVVARTADADHANEDQSDAQRLVAYIVPHAEGSASEFAAQEQDDLVTQWQSVWDETYLQPQQQNLDLTFDISGWNSSYTGQPIPSVEMREWVDGTVQRIFALQPQRVLEIGCGTGLLLFRVAPHCVRYLATDFSPAVVAALQRQVAQHQLPGVEIVQQAADDFSGIVMHGYDVIILNSVVQYFPSADYLVHVLTNAVHAAGPKGQIFIGDVRSLPLLKAFHMAIQLQQAAPTLSQQQLSRMIEESLERERELVIDPALFFAFKELMPQISRVEVQLKRGHYHNELTRFRYDVVLHLGDEAHTTSDFPQFSWQDKHMTLSQLREHLRQEQPAVLGITHVPSARVWADTQAVTLMESADVPDTVAGVGEALQALEREQVVDPEDFWALGNEVPYSVEITWASPAAGADGYYDVLLTHKDASPGGNPGFTRETIQTKQGASWSKYTSNPLHTRATQQLIPVLRRHLQEHLADYMVPSAFMFLESLPLTPNKKVDRRALPDPEQLQSHTHGQFVAPAGPLEETLADIWAAVLRFAPISVRDNFFDLGGHSLLATQVISRTREAFQIALPLRTLFEKPTIAQFAQHIEDLLLEEVDALTDAEAEAQLDAHLSEHSV